MSILVTHPVAPDRSNPVNQTLTLANLDKEPYHNLMSILEASSSGV